VHEYYPPRAKRWILSVPPCRPAVQTTYLPPSSSVLTQEPLRTTLFSACHMTKPEVCEASRHPRLARPEPDSQEILLSSPGGRFTAVPHLTSRAGRSEIRYRRRTRGFNQSTGEVLGRHYGSQTSPRATQRPLKVSSPSPPLYVIQNRPGEPHRVTVGADRIWSTPHLLRAGPSQLDRIPDLNLSNSVYISSSSPPPLSSFATLLSGLRSPVMFFATFDEPQARR